MNQFAAYACRNPRGWYAMLRLPSQAHPNPVMRCEDIPELFSNELDALRAANKHLLKYINGNLVRFGDKSSTTPSPSEKAFGTEFRNGRAIKIERKRA